MITPAATQALEARDIQKAYGDTPALRGVSFSVAPGEIVTLLGPSGCGKTTLLRIIAGLEEADTGSLTFQGRSLLGIPPHQRGFGLMFQDYALFPHRDVAGNVAFGLRMQHLPAAAITARVQEMLELVGLRGYERRRVYELSGGERQRVALARSLAPSPQLLMLDEPLGALDRALRERLMDELRAILKQLGVTAISVTHDQSEAFAIADRLILMNAGRIEQQGTPDELYRHPQSRFAARFLGLNNLVDGQVVQADAQQTVVETPLGALHTSASGYHPGSRVTTVIRPEAAHLAQHGTNLINGVVTERSFRGSRTRLTLRHNAQELEFELDAPTLPAEGEFISVALRPDALSLLPQE